MPAVGTRVRWCGPSQSGFVARSYWAAVAAGVQRPPTPAERLELHPGDEGVVTALVGVTAAGQQCALRFDSGYEVDVVLPSALVDVDTLQRA